MLVRDKSQDIKSRDGNHWESESLSHTDTVLRELTGKGVQLEQQAEDWEQQELTMLTGGVYLCAKLTAQS